MICNLFRSLEVISQRGSQLRKWSFNLQSGTRVLGGGFIAAKHLAKFSQVDFILQLRNGLCAVKFSQQKVDFAVAKLSHNLMRLSSNGHNLFISTPIHAPFKVLDS